MSIGSLTMLNELKSKKDLMLLTKKTTLGDRILGLNALMEVDKKHPYINYIILGDHRYANDWVNRIVSPKKIKLKTLFYSNFFYLHKNNLKLFSILLHLKNKK